MEGMSRGAPSHLTPARHSRADEARLFARAGVRPRRRGDRHLVQLLLLKQQLGGYPLHMPSIRESRPSRPCERGRAEEGHIAYLITPPFREEGQPSHPGSMHRIHASTPLSDLLCGRNGESFVNGSPSQADGASSCQMRCRPPALPQPQPQSHAVNQTVWVDWGQTSSPASLAVLSPENGIPFHHATPFRPQKSPLSPKRANRLPPRQTTGSATADSSALAAAPQRQRTSGARDSRRMGCLPETRSA